MQYFLSILISLCFFSWQNSTVSEIRHEHLNSQIDCDSTPQLNKKIISFVTSKLNKKIGNGECWYLAEAVLNTVDATWDGQYKFGILLNPETDCIYPGDIIQFERVKIKYSKNGGRYEEDMRHHTAIIYNVNAKGNFDLAHQNYGHSKRKVGITNLELKNIVRGDFFIYRPTK